ncbi:MULTISPECIES: hypothetical protein [Klebsiella]|nr:MULTISPECIES: hypothetical protein [Klebsiella]MDH8673227.1 hypothetical protein [Klebsiella pneumoniae]MDL4075833.1 hypothetical protein [Klebsiella quasipneumoniae]MDU3203756.1 hypothetical protein [Klebsiella sp.]SVJ93634.1 Uncharacterised protein [Klebsiella pneumoniae]
MKFDSENYSKYTLRRFAAAANIVAWVAGVIVAWIICTIIEWWTA